MEALYEEVDSFHPQSYFDQHSY